MKAAQLITFICVWCCTCRRRPKAPAGLTDDDHGTANHQNHPATDTRASSSLSGITTSFAQGSDSTILATHEVEEYEAVITDFYTTGNVGSFYDGAGNVDGKKHIITLNNDQRDNDFMRAHEDRTWVFS